MGYVCTIYILISCHCATCHLIPLVIPSASIAPSATRSETGSVNFNSNIRPLWKWRCAAVAVRIPWNVKHRTWRKNFLWELRKAGLQDSHPLRNLRFDNDLKRTRFDGLETNEGNPAINHTNFRFESVRLTLRKNSWLKTCTLKCAIDLIDWKWRVRVEDSRVDLMRRKSY